MIDVQATNEVVLTMAFTAFMVNYLRHGLRGIRHDFYVWRLTRAARKAAHRARHGQDLARRP